MLQEIGNRCSIGLVKNRIPMIPTKAEALQNKQIPPTRSREVANRLARTPPDCRLKEERLNMLVLTVSSETLFNT